MQPLCPQETEQPGCAGFVIVEVMTMVCSRDVVSWVGVARDANFGELCMLRACMV